MTSDQAMDETVAVAPILRACAGRPETLIAALHQVQDHYGYVPRCAAHALADGLGVPLARVYEVVTFYRFFRLQPPGRVTVTVCTGTACHLSGAGEVVTAFAHALDAEPGGRSADGLFQLECVRCVGCCSLAPVAVVGGQTYGRLRPGRVGAIVGEWRERLRGGDDHEHR